MEELISMNGINVETRIIGIYNVGICNVTMKLYTCFNSRYEYCNKHTFLLIIGGSLWLELLRSDLEHLELQVGVLLFNYVKLL
jgi:hypothetical protein